MPVVVNRWLGGMLTNQKTIGERVKHLKRQEERMANGELTSKYSKLEVQRFQEEIEAIKLNIPVVGLVDTNVDPRTITYPVPCNDDALKAIELVCDYVKQAIELGKASRKVEKVEEKKEEK